MADTANALPAIKPRRRGRLNVPLFVGAILVLLVVLIGIFGPDWAPHDPTETHVIIQQEDGSWLTPPVAAFAMLEHPLGTDRFGRDLLSQLLFAVRPTLTLVLIVASVRMVLGIWLGAMAGWFRNPATNALNNFINTAATVPALIVALAAIAAVGVDLGVWAFVIGLSLTGWADTAQLVREQTRLTRQQTYIEASRAMGANHTQVIGRHLLRQIMPLVWVVFNLEVSGTLMATAGLGFLGYYIGGDAFIQVDDAVAARVASQFELGQMLATTTEISLEPWGMVAAGSMVFISILGFNLLGEGLRQQLRLAELSTSGLLANARLRIGNWFEDHVINHVYGWSEHRAFWPGMLSILLIAAASGAGYARYQEQQSRVVAEGAVSLFVPGGHLWANQGHDPYGSYWTEAAGPAQPALLWGFQDPGGFTGSPAVDQAGNLYILTRSGFLIALDSDGQPIWDLALDITPVGSPALDPNGNVLVVGSDGSLTKVSPGGTQLWRYQQDISVAASNGAVSDEDGNTYYPVSGLVQAVSPDGDPLWRTVTHYFPHTTPPKLSPDQQYVYIQESVLDAHTGELIEVARPLASGINLNTQSPLHVVDRGGRTHMLLGNFAVQWELQGNEPITLRSLEWAAGTFGLGNTDNVGITPNDTFWAFYTGGFTQPTVIWMNLDGRVIATTRWPQNQSALIGVDHKSIYYFCGRLADATECLAFPLGASEETWRVRTPQSGDVVGGALIEGRLYLSTANGWLYAIGDS